MYVPVCAAFAAALLAHAGIDVAGDYLLSHDTYDDVAHGSRLFVFGLIAALLASMFAGGLAAAAREARGSVDEFARALHSSLRLPLVPFVAITSGIGACVLVAMEAVDATSAGRAVDDLGDLFGGSLPLGLATLALSAISCALVARRAVRAVAGIRRSVVRALAVVFSRRVVGPCAASQIARRRVRTIATTRFSGTSRSGRAPPDTRYVRPVFL